MKLKTRRILLVSCIILFLIIFPLVVLNSFGYGYDPIDKKLVRTGIIYITANPQDNIKIYVDGKEEKERLSVKGIFKKDYVLFNLMPHNYDIRVTKDGYSQWEKRLSVSPGLNTYARPLLLPINPVNNILFEGKDIFSWSASEDFKKIAYLKKINNKITFSVYDTKNKITSTIALNEIDPEFDKSMPQTGDLKASFYWDTNSEKIILEIGSKISRFVALNTSNNTITYLGKINPDAKIINGAWVQNNNIFIYQTDKKELYHVNMAQDPGTASKISDNVSGFTVNNNNIYYLDAINLYLYSFSSDNPADKRQISNEPLLKPDTNQENPPIQDAEIFISDASDIAIINSNKDLFIVKQNDGSPIYMESNVNHAEFSAGGGSLLYNSFFEIYTYSIGDKAKNLITRVGQKVDKSAWYKDYEHIWFANNNVIKNIEIDSRPITNIIDFAPLATPIQNFSYNANTNIIYYDQIDSDTLSIHELIVGN